MKSLKNLIIKIVLKNLSWQDFETLKIHLKNWNKKPPILIYTMGKVGSMTVYQSLKEAKLGNPVYHIHFLTDY